MKHYFLKLSVLFLLSFLIACQNDKVNKEESGEETSVNVKAPKFNDQNAYNFVEKQVAFGPRVPGSKGHDSCAAFLEAQLKSNGAEVFVQKAEVTGGSGKKYNIKNIIGSFNPAATDRILLCAHWDTRAMADQDKERTKEPILGADDGGSGVGILLEIANLMAANPLKNIGVDIVFFDAEDQGESGTDQTGRTWCLGAQHWSKNPHQPNYKANFGILLDMVGARGAKFPKEGFSMKRAPFFVDRIWKTAAEQGFGDFFTNEEERQIIDDHVFVNEIRQIPTVDIIHLTKDSPTGFGSHWHTHKDNMDVISKSTLLAVGQTVTQVIYEEEEMAKK